MTRKMSRYGAMILAVVLLVGLSCSVAAQKKVTIVPLAASTRRRGLRSSRPSQREFMEAKPERQNRDRVSA